MRRFGAHRRRAGALGSDTGASAIEFALVVPILLLLVFGIIEFGLVMRDYLSVASSVRVGARIAATGAGAGPGTCPGAPVVCVPANVPALAQAGADAIQQAGTAMPQDLIDYIFVYKANDKGYPGATGVTTMPTNAAGCTAAGNCVVFRWNKVLDRFVYQEGTWNSSTINACINSGLAQSVGIYMKATHPYLTGFFGANLGLSDRAVMKFEPLPAISCTAGSHT
jgi:hypothetical protein